MTIVSSGTLALQDAGTNPTGSTTYFINDTFTAGQATNKQVDGDFIEVDPDTEEEETVTEELGTYTVNGFNTGGASGTTSWDASAQWDVPWDDESAVSPTTDLGSLGSGLTTTYTDGSSTSRTVRTAVIAVDTGAPYGATRFAMLALAGTSVPNTNNTFTQMVYGGLTLNRSDATDVFNSYGCTVWVWDDLTAGNITAAGAGTGTRTFQLVNSLATGSLNNGIAEEFGGADSSNVALSDYYKGGSLVTSNVTASIPTTGNPIAFSDFYGATYVAGFIHATAMTSGTSGGYGYVNAGYNRSLQTEQVTQGTVSDHTITSFAGGSNFIFTGLMSSTTTSSATTGNIDFTVKDSGTAPANSGFTTLKIWLGQGSGSGTPDFTLSRSSATYTGYTTSGIYGGRSWRWASQSNPNQSAFHPLTGANGTNFYMEIT